MSKVSAKRIAEIIKEENKAIRFNEGKVQWSLLDFKAFETVVRVLEFGKNKYGAENWKLSFDRNALLESAQRHLVELFSGNELDSETGLPHAAHVISNMMFYIHHFNKTKNKNK